MSEKNVQVRIRKFITRKQHEFPELGSDLNTLLDEVEEASGSVRESRSDLIRKSPIGSDIAWAI